MSHLVTAVSLIVLRCADIAATKRFYEAIGLVFHAEKHGSGLDHWSSRVGETVLELYPAAAEPATVGRLGFRVTDVRECVRALAKSGARIGRPFDPSTGTAMVIDPDGTKIELSEAGERWAVWRQDDNGNRFQISGGHTQEDAERQRAEFEARGHKQLYWIARDTPGARDG